MNIQFGFYNLWLPFLVVYTGIWIYMSFIGKKNNRPIEDPEIYSIQSKQTQFIFGFLPTILLFASSFLVPINFSKYFIPGTFVSLTGFIFNIICFNSFANNPNPLNTKGIYKYSRNPMYVSGLLVFLGFAIMGWGSGIVSYVYAFLVLVWVISTHYMVKSEEKFLEKKYGEEYLTYKSKVRRYL